MLQLSTREEIQCSAVYLFRLIQPYSFSARSNVLSLLLNRNGHVSIYDFMTQTLKLEYNTLREAYSYTLLCGGKMLACGDKKHIFFFELETGKRIGFYRDIHSDVINHLVAHPSYPTVFASGSEDGLVFFHREFHFRFACLMWHEETRTTQWSVFSRQIVEWRT